MIEILCSAAAKDKKMKAIAIGILASIGMYLFGTRPLVNAVVGVLVYVVAA